jgi:hypothetical protein
VVRELLAKIGGAVPSLEEDPDAGFDPSTDLAPKDQRKGATIIASGIGGFPAITDAVRTVDLRGVRGLSPFTIPSFLVNLAAGHVSIRHVPRAWRPRSPTERGSVQRRTDRRHCTQPLVATTIPQEMAEGVVSTSRYCYRQSL